MRSGAFILAALLTAAAAPALASGLPQVGDAQVGPYRVALHNDSPSLVIGLNTITVEIAALPADWTVSLSLDGPQGQTAPVPLQQVLLWGQPESGANGHSGHGDAHDDGPSPGNAASHSHSHEAAPDDHAAPPPASGHNDVAEHGAHGADVTTLSSHGSSGGHAPAASLAVTGSATPGADRTYLARGGVHVPAPGAWSARVALQDPHGATYSASIPLDAMDGGPNTLYLGAAASLIAGSVLFGAIQRRRGLGHTQNDR